ncbi:unnamed protein product, partial [Musa hybrid cultivar]
MQRLQPQDIIKSKTGKGWGNKMRSEGHRGPEVEKLRGVDWWWRTRTRAKEGP